LTLLAEKLLYHTQTHVLLLLLVLFSLYLPSYNPMKLCVVFPS
jgi:hypothetical protein